MQVIKNISDFFKGNSLKEEICGCKIEIKYHDSKIKMIIHGRKRVLSHDDTRTIVETNGNSVEITGRNLICDAYVGGALEISGEILDIKFNKEKKLC